VATPAPAQTVRGHVVEADVATPIADASLQLVDGGGRILADVRSDSVGWFVLAQPSGRHGDLRVIARRIGFYNASIELTPGAADEGTEMLIAMRRLALDTVRVSSSTSRSLSLGLHPSSLAIRPITRDIIERELTRANDILTLLRLRQIPGVWVDKGGCVRIHMGYCAVLIVDGMPNAGPVHLANVEEMLVLTPNEAQVLFGAKAAGGAIVVYTIPR
jgi:hypothetical protein